ncbi:uncharacterized protein PG998_004509 [Apiospora kogelbergensis]|uniref:uncharacterized protein n=1 Tax=Apiospora kogelbergensis TaxID=1337665 RepID=UPI00313241E5
MARFRFITIIPLVTSAIAFALHLILLNSGATVAQSSGYFLLSIDTSHIFERIIVVKNANNAQAVGDNNGTSTATPTGLPTGAPTATPIVTPIVTPTVTPTVTTTGTATSTTTSGLLDGIGNLIPDLIPDLFNGSDSGQGSGSQSGGGLLGGIGNLLPNLQQSAATNDATGDADTGVKRFFGNLRNGIDQFFNGLINKLENRFVDSLTKLAPGIDKFITGLIGGLTAEVNGQIQHPAPSTCAPRRAPWTSVSTLNLASLYISLGTSVLNFALAPAVFFRPDSRALVLANIAVASLTPGSLLTGAVASTLAMAVVRDLANDVGKALSVRAGLGAGALVLLWFSWFLSLATAAFWDLYWFVYLRREVWVKMRRPADEVGSWRKSFAGARRRIKVREDGAVEEETSSQRGLRTSESTEEGEEKKRAKAGDGVPSIGNYRLSPISLGRPSSSIRSTDPIYRGRVLP